MSIIRRTPEEVTLLVFCRRCGREVEVSIPRVRVETAETLPVSHSHLHGDPPHILTIYVDRQYQVRGSDISDGVTIEEPVRPAPLTALTLLQVPPRLKKTALAMLKLREATSVEVAQVTGKTPGAESQYLGMLWRMGYLIRTKVKRRYRYRIALP